MNVKSEKTVVGLTGGIACGKSSALCSFADMGWSVISADFLAGEILRSDRCVQAKIKQRWGKKILNRSGSIDKAAIARIVFTKELERKWIEGILHPIIRSKWISFVQSCPSSKCMIELPLLFENNLQDNFTCTISLFAPTPMIFHRLQSRGLSMAESESRIRCQLPISDKVELSDFVLWGGGSMEFLNDQIQQLDLTLSSLSIH
ncbi:MAG: dephospho-CoA kinase [Opitutae bacterium]